MTIVPYGGGNPQRVFFNGSEVTKVVYDGTTVWERLSSGTWTDEREEVTVSGPIFYALPDPWPSSGPGAYDVDLPAMTWTSSSKTLYRYDADSPAWSDLRAYAGGAQPTLALSVQASFYKASGVFIGQGDISLGFTRGELAISHNVAIAANGGSVSSVAVSTTRRGYLFIP